jgi:hypothetical protein
MERYTERLAAYAPAPLPVSAPLLVIAAEYDGQFWQTLSDAAVLQQAHGVHFDLVTWRIDDLATRLRSWLSGDPVASSIQRRPIARVTKEEIIPPGLHKRDCQQSPHCGHQDKAAVSAGSDKDNGSALIAPTKNGSLSLRLKRFFNYALR